MEIDIQMQPGSSIAKVNLQPGEQITAEGGAMVAMSNDMTLETTTHKKGKRGIMKGIKRMLTGENFFLNHYTPGSNGGEIFLAPTLPGDMFVHELNDSKLIVQGGSYLACEPDVEIDFSWQGLKSALSGEGIFWINLNGTGKVIVNAFGMIYPVEVDGEYIVDTGHIVAFDDSLQFKITKAGASWTSSILGGEGFVCKFSGQGVLWCQSHNPKSFGRGIGPKLRPA